MRVLVTGHDGYIGDALVPLLQGAGHDVVGLDSCLFGDCGSASAASRSPSSESTCATSRQRSSPASRR